MASLIIFVAYSAFMVALGYYWRKNREEHASLMPRDPEHAAEREVLWRGMLGKI